MRLAVLGSGSSGNALVVASGAHRLLVDAGFSCRMLEKRLAILGEDAADLDAVLLTHEHGDHVRGARRLMTRHGMPVHGTAGTLDACGLSPAALASAAPAAAGQMSHVVRSGEPFEVPGFRVEAFAIPHDAREPVGYVIEDEAGTRLGVAADLGTRSRLAWARLARVDALVLETNHDLQMLRAGPYPWHLKQRVAGRHGHLSNREAALGLRELVSDRLRLVVAYHLSRTNNMPALVAQMLGEVLDREGSSAEVVLTRQDEPTPWLEVTQ